MNGKQLKNSILQWAIQGKLVPQDPNDEPASVLLDKIRQEKERLIKEKKIKRDKNASIIYRGEDNSYYEKFADGKMVCIDDEIPFDIPHTWSWLRLKHASEIARGGSPRPIKEYLTDLADGINWIKIGDTEKDGMYINSTKEKIKPEGLSKSRFVHKGDFLLTNSMSFGRPYITNIDGCIHDGWLVISPIGTSYIQKFLFYLLSSGYAFSQFAGKVSGAVVKNLNSDKVADALFPLPPYNEQQRILDKLDELIPKINTYGLLEDEISSMNLSLKPKLRKSILQEAIQGRLVVQDASEEPATILLQRIKEEKLRLVKEGKLKKKDVIDSTIFRGDDNKYYEQIGKTVTDISEEIPFSIPDSWAWSRLSGVVNIIMGQSPDSNDIFEADEVNNAYEFHQGKISFTDKYIAPSGKWCKRPSRIADIGSLLVCVRAPIGDVNITQRQIGIGRGLAAITGYKGISPDFLFHWLLAHKKILVDKGTGSTFKAITVEVLKDLIIPTPPLGEQQRIVNHIETLYEGVSKLIF